MTAVTELINEALGFDPAAHPAAVHDFVHGQRDQVDMAELPRKATKQLKDALKYNSDGVPISPNHRESGGEVLRDGSAMRIFTPVEDNIPKQAKFYVGCKPAAGRLTPRVIDLEDVFFYAEFWNRVPDNLKSKERRTELMKVIKYTADAYQYSTIIAYGS